MSYKSILVQADGSDPVAPRIEIAAGIALTEEAHLIGAACTDTDAAFDRFERVAREMGVTSFE